MLRTVTLLPQEYEFLQSIWRDLYLTGIQERRHNCTGMSSFSFLSRRITFDAASDMSILAEDWIGV